MHYSIYIPRAVGANPEHLTAVGLGELLRPDDEGPQFGDLIANGPDGGAGLYVVWTGSEPVYRPNELQWKPAKPDKVRNLPAGRFWWGVSGAEPLTPGDLVRTKLFRGHFVELKEQTWIIPNILLLPHDFVLDDNGEEAREVCATHRQMYDRGMWAYNELKTHIETSLPSPEKELRQYVRDMLTLNYRLFPDLISHLRLLSDDSWFSLACNSCDLATLLAIERDVAKKKMAALLAAQTPPT
ncbi:MAG: hypothetical protein V4719_26615 [Planctomycetota bacterium]